MPEYPIQRDDDYESLPKVTMFPDSILNEADAGDDEGGSETYEEATKDRNGWTDPPESIEDFIEGRLFEMELHGELLKGIVTPPKSENKTVLLRMKGIGIELPTSGPVNVTAVEELTSGGELRSPPRVEIPDWTKQYRP